MTENDYRPLEPVHLIDGDPETCWSSRTQTSHDCEPTWIRLDLVAETTISHVVLRKRPSVIDRSKPGSHPIAPGASQVGQAMVDHLEIRVSTDGAHWKTVFAGASGDAPDKSDFVFALAPVQAKMVLIIGSGYKHMENLRACFSIACLEVLDTDGANVALVSRGTGITVSSTHVSLGQEIESHRWLWPVQHDMGLKWARIGYHDDTINWHWVEQEKGVLSLDPVSEAAITELLENGIEVVMCLDFGNRLYQKDPTRRLPQLWEWYYENPEPPKTDEALAAWARYIRFMVGKFRDRIHYFEIWNEWNIATYWGDVPDYDLFARLTRIAIPIIRELAPNASVMLGSYAGFPRLSHLSEAERQNLEQNDWLLRAIREFATQVDVIGYHPFYALDPANPNFLKYEADVRLFKAYCERMGFRGNQYLASEFNIAANYPECEDEGGFGYAHHTSELQKAKYCSRVAAFAYGAECRILLL